jgi:phosphotransferase system enzyme I (PtsI)
MPSKNLSKKNSARIKFEGLGVSSGVAIGHVRLYHVSSLEVGEAFVLKSKIDTEVKRFEDAVDETQIQIEELGKRITDRGEDKALNEVLTMHILLLRDKMIYNRTIDLIKNNHYGAEYALACVVREARNRYSGLPDLFRDRIKDVEDIARRVMDTLRGVHTQSLENIEEEVVVIARDLSPSDTSSMRRDKVLGFVTEAGGKTSHTAILARAREIPAVVGVSGIAQVAQDNDTVIIDGETGTVILNPTQKEIQEYQDLQHSYNVRQSHLIELGELESITLDGFVIDLAANIEFASEVETLTKYKADGVGLYRTEYLFLNRFTVPTEQEQYEHYIQVAEAMAPNPVIIRTLDIGGDKFAHALETPNEMNPFLGCRAIRFSLVNESLFRDQLRAILRASVHNNLFIMYPLISGQTELRQANKILRSIQDELKEEGVPFDESIRVGAMIEVPSAVMVARDLAQYVQFFSIGTNDLIQYTLAVDRGNEKIAHMYQPLHPAVLRMISSVVDVGHEFTIPVDVCGEMASDPACAMILLALGVERLSMAPPSIPKIKQVVRSVSIVQLRNFGEELLKLSCSNEIKQLIHARLPNLLPNHEELSINLHESSILAVS